MVAPFYLDTSADSSSITTDTFSSFKPSQINNYEMNVIAKTLATSAVSFTSFLSSYTYYASSGWSVAVSFPNTTGLTSPTDSNSAINTNPAGILQTGITLPSIDPKLASDIAIGAVGISLISLIILLIRRYWLVLIAALIGIIAVFKVPSRKISVMDVYHNETRQNIIDILNYRRGQGETVRNISRELEIPLPTLLWHLQILEEFELIAKIKVKREVVIIAMDYVEDFDMELKEFEMTFKSDKAKTFYDYLLNLDQNETFTAKSVINHTGWSSRTVIRYISKLLELEIIQQNGSAKGYRISTKYYFKLKDLN